MSENTKTTVQNKKNDKKFLVVYFSYGGDTKKVARGIAKLTHADIVEVSATDDYSNDLKEVSARSKKELDENIYPEITLDKPCDVAAYDFIFIGTPNWWNTVAGPIKTFLRDNDFSGKELALFSSEGGSATKPLTESLMDLVSDATLYRGITVYSGATNEEQLRSWLENIGVL